jgi:hypothetical protein
MTMTDPRNMTGTAQDDAQPVYIPSGYTDPTQGTPGPQRGNGVNGPATAKPRSKPKDVTEYGKFVCRMLRAFGRRAAAEDPWVIRDMLDARDTLDRSIQEAVTALHDAGYSWAEIGQEIGMTRQAVHKRWGPAGE